MRTTKKAITAFAASVFALSASVASGQDAQPKLTAAAGGGFATPFYSEFDFTARNWDASVRGSMSRHVSLEGFYEQWEHVKRAVFLDQARQGPSGFLGRVARLDERTTYRMRTAGVNVLATGGSGRVTFVGGGGIGVLAYDERFNSTASGCDAGVAQSCVPTESTFSSDGFTGQGVAEVDVAVIRRVQVFGRYLLVLPLSDPTFGHSSFGAGVRVTLW